MKQNPSEREPKQSIREIQLGEWFNPFQGYADVPYFDKYESRNLESKLFPYMVQQVDRFTFGLSWSRGLDLQKIKGVSVVISPSGEEIVQKEDILKYEEKIGSKLLTIAVVFPKYKHPDVVYQAELRYQNGKRYFCPISEECLNQAGPFNWSEEGNGENICILIPEVENTLEKIQMRLVPKTESQHV
jgi:hypothetical protein